MKYIYVENNQIAGNPEELPRNWKNVSNFYLLNDEQLKSYGWYPFRFVEADILPNQFYDGSDFVIEENEVVEYQKVRNKTQEEIDNEIQSTWRAIRGRRNDLLLKCDWTQLSDAPLTEEVKQSWIDYRQELRDITLQTDPFNIVWPTQPGQIDE